MSFIAALDVRVGDVVIEVDHGAEEVRVGAGEVLVHAGPLGEEGAREALDACHVGEELHHEASEADG